MLVLKVVWISSTIMTLFTANTTDVLAIITNFRCLKLDVIKTGEVMPKECGKILSETKNVKAKIFELLKLMYEEIYKDTLNTLPKCLKYFKQNKIVGDEELIYYIPY